jgi:hypothetical protein
MSNTTSFRPRSGARTPGRTDRGRRGVDPAPTPLRSLLRDTPPARLFVRVVGAWALAAGRPVGVDALAVVALVRLAEGRPIRQWTQRDVEAFLWNDALAWCRAYGIPPPPDLAETLWTVFDHLSATDGLAPGSDPPADLRVPLVAIGGLGSDGRRRLRAPRRRRSA